MNTPQPKSYTGPSGGLKKESQWLAAEDIGDREVSVTIEDVELFENVEFEQGRKERRVGALKFAGKEKRMILNSTNRRTLTRLYGMETGGWRGQRVTLHVQKLRRAFGEREHGIRIKAEPAKVAAAATEGGAS